MKKHVYKIITDPLLSGSAIMIVGSNSASALNYLYHLIVGRLLGPSLYGEFASLISVIGLLGIIPSAVGLVIVKQISSTRNEFETINLISWFKTKLFVLSLLCSIFILISSPLITSFLKIDKISYLLLIGISFLFSLQAGFNRFILQGLLRFREFVITILLENTSKLLVGILFIIAGFAVLGALFGFVIASFLGFYLTSYYLKTKDQSASYTPPPLKPMFLLTIPILIQAVSTTSIYTIDVVLVKHFFPSHDAGIYASLSTLGKVIFFGAGPISTVMFPLVAKLSSRGENYRRVLIYSLVATLFFALGVCFFYWLTPEVAIYLLFGSLYLESSKLLILFGIFISLFTLSSLIINFGISLGKNKIVVFPLIFAIFQIILITFFHQTLLMVVLICIGVNALLLLTLLIYLSFEKEFVYGKVIAERDKFNFDNRSSI